MIQNRSAQPVAAAGAGHRVTIKGYDFIRNKYTLGFPNAEVKVGFMENFLKS